MTTTKTIKLATELGISTITISKSEMPFVPVEGIACELQALKIETTETKKQYALLRPFKPLEGGEGANFAPAQTERVLNSDIAESRGWAMLEEKAVYRIACDKESIPAFAFRNVLGPKDFFVVNCPDAEKRGWVAIFGNTKDGLITLYYEPEFGAPVMCFEQTKTQPSGRAESDLYDYAFLGTR